MPIGRFVSMIAQSIAKDVVSKAVSRTVKRIADEQAKQLEGQVSAKGVSPLKGLAPAVRRVSKQMWGENMIKLRGTRYAAAAVTRGVVGRYYNSLKDVSNRLVWENVRPVKESIMKSVAPMWKGLMTKYPAIEAGIEQIQKDYSKLTSKWTEEKMADHIIYQLETRLAGRSEQEIYRYIYIRILKLPGSLDKKKLYRLLVNRTHPDKSKLEHSDMIFRQVHEAWKEIQRLGR